MGVELGFEVVGEEVLAGEVAAEGATAWTAADAAAMGAMTEGGATVGASTALTTAGSFLLKAGMQAGISVLTAKILGNRLNRSETSQGTLVNSLTTVDPIPVIYGTRRVGATVCPVGVSGSALEFLHLICVWGEGPISAIGTVYLDGRPATDAIYAGLVTREDFLGTDGQAASATLVAAFADASRWNTSCTLSGIAYTYLILKWDQTAFAKGKPLVTADVNGRTLFDPRTGTTGFSRNPALALRDYLTNSRYGRGYGSAAIDDTAFAGEAYHCDDLVALPGGATQARYLCDGVVNPDDAPLDIVKGLLSACRGNLIYSGGKYKLKIDRDETVSGASFGYDFTGGAARQFAGGADTPLTVTRAGTATRVNSAGLVEVVAANTLRLDYDPVALTCKGALIEESRTNRCLYSAQFDNAAWSKTNVTVTADATLAPDGASTADKIAATSTAVALCVQPGIIAGGTSASYAIYAKQGSGATDANSFALYNVTTAHDLLIATINYSTGAVTLTSGAGSATAVNAGGGWWRITLSATAGLSAGNTIQCYPCFTGGPETAGEYAYVWGAQVEDGAFATSYIPTTSAAVTRNADVAGVAPLGGWYNAAAGTAFVEFRRDADSFPARLWQFNRNDAGSYVDLILLSSGNYESLPTAGSLAGATDVGTVHRAAMTLKSNDYSLSVDGGAAAAFGAGALAADQNRFQLGNSSGSSQFLNGWIRKFAYIPRRVSDADLKSLTAARFVLSEDNILGAWSWQQPGRRTRFNAVKARFYDPATNYLPNITVWPPAGGAQSVAYLAQDNALVLSSQLELPFTANLYTAQQICQIEAKKSRQPLLVSLNATIAAMALEVGDIVPVAHSTPGWPAAGDPAEGKLFRVEEVELFATDEVRLGLRLYDAAAYSLDALTLQPSLTLTSLPDASVVGGPLNLAAASGTNQLFIAGDGTVVSRLLVTWDVSMNAFVTSGGRVIVQFKRQSDAAWQNFTSLDGTATQAYITPVDDGVTYDVRLAFENSIGARSAFTQISHTVVGKTAPPADVTNFSVSGARLSWSPVTDADLWGYRVRFQPGTSRSWGDALWLHGQGTVQQDVLTTPPFTIPDGAIFGQATLMVKAVDLSGNESQNPAYLIVTGAAAAIANVLQTFDRKAAGFPGTRTNGAVDGSGNLAANGSTLMWAQTDQSSMWKADSTQMMWAPVAWAQMTYEDRIVTAGARAGSKLTLSAVLQGEPWSIQYRENSTKQMWSVDASVALWNSDSAQLMWDTPPYVTWPGQLTVYPDSMFDFLVTTGQGQTQGKISGFTLTLDAPDIAETLANVAISSGGTRLAPVKSYVAIKSVLPVVVNDGGTAVSAKQEDTLATGPLIKTYDGTGAAVNGHVNARIEGY